MKKIALLTIYCLLFTICSSYAQVPADSLPGEYVGMSYYKSPLSNPWTIGIDTLYVKGVDTVNCVDTIELTNQPAPPWFPETYTMMYTLYYSCNNPAPSNLYTLYFANDSIKLIYNDVPQPSPYPHYSFQFYGKRISNKTVGINELSNNEQITVFPNPSSGEFTISNLQDVIYNLNLYNIFGEKILTGNIKHSIFYHTHFDLPKGIYFLEISNENEFNIKKFIIN